MKKIQAAGSSFQSLVDTIRQLRDPDTGCPWDLKQTHASLKEYLIEEAYELLQAIDDTPEAIPEELGDVLLQVLLHSQIAADAKTFSITDVIDTLNEKLIQRHPHVFGDATCADADAVTRSWEKSKKAEKRGLLDGIPAGLPALHKANLIGERTERVGFDWHDATAVTDKVQEEVAEYLEAVENNQSSERIEEEFGDLLFTLTQLARKQGFNSEAILQRACAKFTARFQKMEATAPDPLTELDDVRLNELWQQVKKEDES